MDEFACNLLAALNGITQTHRGTGIPISTIASWKRAGIPPSRIDHLKRYAKDCGIRINWKTGARIVRGGGGKLHVESSVPVHSPTKRIAPELVA